MKYATTSKRIKEALYEKGMSQQELAEKSGVAKASISHYANGSHCPSNDSAAKMAAVLGVNPVWLMGFEVDKYTESIELTEEEKKLVLMCRKLSEKSKTRMLAYIQALADMED